MKYYVCINNLTTCLTSIQNKRLRYKEIIIYDVVHHGFIDIIELNIF
jgi:hypothetical protein